MAGVGTVPAGWYADPSQSGQQRYWDGAGWTEHTAPAAPVAPSAVGATGPFIAGAPPQRNGATAAVIGAVAVVAVVVLAAIAVPVFLSQRGEAQDASVQSDLRNTVLEFEAFYTDRGHYPSSAAELGLASTADEFIAHVAPDGQAFCLEASRGDAWWSYDSLEPGFRTGRC